MCVPAMQRRPGIRIIHHSASSPAGTFYGGGRGRSVGARATGGRRAREEVQKIAGILRAASRQYHTQGNLDGIPFPNNLRYNNDDDDDENRGVETGAPLPLSLEESGGDRAPVEKQRRRRKKRRRRSNGRTNISNHGKDETTIQQRSTDRQRRPGSPVSVKPVTGGTPIETLYKRFSWKPLEELDLHDWRGNVTDALLRYVASRCAATLDRKSVV